MTNYLFVRTLPRVLHSLALVAAFFSLSGLAMAEKTHQGFIDPLDAPAITDAAAFRKPMMAITREGNRLLAVGVRGVIVLSEDAGRTWRQIGAPVQSDLTAVRFSSPQHGWAVGHDGVILASSDAGNTWTRQLDGRMAARQFSAHYRALVDAGRKDLQPFLAEVERNHQRGPTLPYLDVVFDDDLHGFAVGSFGMVAFTQDGGKNWLPGLEKVDNPDLLSLYCARKIGPDLFLAGERGMVYRFDRQRGVFARLPTGYAGSLFGITGNERVLVAYGLRGTVAVSRNGGASWQVSALPVPAAVVGADMLADGRVILASINGMLWVGSADASDFQPLPMEYGAAAMAVASIAPDTVVVGGLRGVVVQQVPRP